MSHLPLGLRENHSHRIGQVEAFLEKSNRVLSIKYRMLLLIGFSRWLVRQDMKDLHEHVLWSYRNLCQSLSDGHVKDILKLLKNPTPLLDKESYRQPVVAREFVEQQIHDDL